MPNKPLMLTITQAAARRGFSRQMIHTAILDGRLTLHPAIDNRRLDAQEVDRLEKKPAGRPKKD